jgi:anti-anti-sigma factor
MVDQLMRISVRHLRSATVVMVQGVVDSAAARELEVQLHQAVECCVARPVRVVMDLSAVDYLDRDGLDCLLRVQRKVIALSGSFELADDRRAAVVRIQDDGEPPGAVYRGTVESGVRETRIWCVNLTTTHCELGGTADPPPGSPSPVAHRRRESGFA